MLRNIIFILAAAAVNPLSAGFECTRSALSPGRPCPYPQKDEQGAPKVEATAMLWQAKMEGLEFASKSFIPADPASAVQSFQEKLFIPDFAWKPGFKIAAGANLPYDGWDAEARYTYYHGELTDLKKRFDSQIGPTGVGIVPLWHYPFISVNSGSDPLRFRYASTNWKLAFNTMDLEFGREFYAFPTLPVRLHLGAKAAWVTQTYRASYSGGTLFTGILDTPASVSMEYLTSKMTFASHLWGLGPRAGVNSKWNMGWGFSLIADAALSLLSSYTSFTTKYDDTVLNATDGELLAPHLKLKEKIKELTPALETTLGFTWGHCFCCTCRPIYFQATVAYEVQYWWAQNHARRNYPYQAPANMWDSRGALQMQGLTASLRWDY